jgi:hypothetical protein
VWSYIFSYRRVTENTNDIYKYYKWQHAFGIIFPKWKSYGCSKEKLATVSRLQSSSLKYISRCTEHRQPWLGPHIRIQRMTMQLQIAPTPVQIMQDTWWILLQRSNYVLGYHIDCVPVSERLQAMKLNTGFSCKRQQSTRRFFSRAKLN